MRRRFAFLHTFRRTLSRAAVIFVALFSLVLLVSGTVAIAANGAPTASADVYDGKQDETLIVAAPGVLQNDSDPDGNIITVMLVTTTSAGSLTINQNGSFTYVPNTGFFGPDQFVYKVTDGALESQNVTVRINVARYNNKPLTSNDAYSTPVNTGFTIAKPGVLSNDSDLEGAKLTARLEIAPKYGSMSMQSDGSFSYVPEEQWNGTVVAWYRANDGIDDSPSTSISIQVGIANQAPVAVNDVISTIKNTPIDIYVLANDSDPEGVKRLLSAPGRSSKSGYVDMGTEHLRYTPLTNFVGEDTFTYVMTDGSYRETATVTVTVVEGTPAPVVPPATQPTVPSTPPSSSDGSPVAPPVSPAPASSTLPPGSLVKSPLAAAVYWLGADGKRHVFPNEATYRTWYRDFSGVITITPAELSALPLGANVTYRPGVRMLKVPSAPTVYVVERNGLLRPLGNENVAFAIYGSSWARLVEDLPEAFFFSYSVGDLITSANQYNPAQAEGTARTILENVK